MVLAMHSTVISELVDNGLHKLNGVSISIHKNVALIQEEDDTMVWTIPIRWDLNIVMVLARSKADMSPTRILWIVLWIVQYVPVLPIPALNKGEIVLYITEIEQFTKHHKKLTWWAEPAVDHYGAKTRWHMI